MEGLLLLRSLGGLMVVLALLFATLWAVRRYDIRLPGRIGGGGHVRLAIAGRINIDAKRSLLLIRRDDAEHLLLIAPEGHMLLGDAGMRDDTPFAICLADCRALDREYAAAAPLPPAPVPAPISLHIPNPRHDPVPLIPQ